MFREHHHFRSIPGCCNPVILCCLMKLRLIYIIICYVF
nr:MAG TPA: hypothetical protein [Caudoviricetes sp.]DAV29791.1 MAG TPA: hypothetical protein [Caudoviricetes sp.]